MMLIDKDLLKKISEEAENSPRLRMNYNFHDSLDAPAQRLLNALQPGTQLPIHRHQHTSETYILLQGKIRVLFYNENKMVIDSSILDPSESVFGVHIPIGQWHTIEVLESNSVIFEVKDGPYMPINNLDILA